MNEAKDHLNGILTSLYQKVVVAFHRYEDGFDDIDKIIDRADFEEQAKMVEDLKTNKPNIITRFFRQQNYVDEKFTAVEGDQSDGELIETLDKADKNAEANRAMLLHQQIYRNIGSLTQLYDLKGLEMKSPLMTYLASMVTKKLKTNPKMLGFVNKKNTDTINLKSFYLSKEYIDPFISGIQKKTDFKKLDLTRNQLKGDDAAKLIHNLPGQLEELVLSDNPDITHGFINALNASVFLEREFRLRTLIIENCNIGNTGAEYIGDSLRLKHCKLTYLDISKNKIGEKGAAFIGQGLKINKNLRILFMHWNNLGPKGGIHIAEALVSNYSLQVLDLSFCGMGFKKQYVDPTSYENVKARPPSMTDLMKQITVQNQLTEDDILKKYRAEFKKF